METEEIVEMVKGVLVKTTEVGLGDSSGVTAIVNDGTCNKGERTIGGMGGDNAETNADTIAVSVREGDKEEEEIIGATHSKGSHQSYSVTSPLEKYMRRW